jgi:ABC-type Fe3+-hydroxamate transport system substrate-binding protein
MIKRTSLILLVLSSLVLAACATTAAAPNVTGVISRIDGNTVTVTPANGGEPVTVTLTWGTRVFQPNGLEADGTSVLAVGHPVQVWLANGTQNAARIHIGQ